MKQSSVVTNGINTKTRLDEGLTRHSVSHKTCISNHFPLARQTETDRQTDRQAETERETETEAERERETERASERETAR